MTKKCLTYVLFLGKGVGWRCVWVGLQTPALKITAWVDWGTSDCGTRSEESGRGVWLYARGIGLYGRGVWLYSWGACYIKAIILVAITFALQPICKATREEHALHLVLNKLEILL